VIFTQLVQANLTTKFIGKTIEYYQILESTNSEAWELIKDGGAHGTVVITDNQTSGKGRRSNIWISAPSRSLTFSVILSAEKIGDLKMLPLTAAIAAADAFKAFGLPAELKWPNDILINQKKAGGILSESKYRGGEPSSAVVGIGLNVNEEKEDFPAVLADLATSMYLASGNHQQRERVLAECLNVFEHCLMLSNDDVIQKWTKRCGHIGKQISFSSGGETVSGIFTGLNDSATAVVEVNGKQKTYSPALISIEANS